MVARRSRNARRDPRPADARTAEKLLIHSGWWVNLTGDNRLVRRFIISLLELFRLAAGWLIIGYILYAVVTGLLGGSVASALVLIAIGIATFLALAVVYG